jgi:hypothetical protein
MPQGAAVLQAAQSTAIQVENPAVLATRMMLLSLASADFFYRIVLPDIPDSPAIHIPRRRQQERTRLRVGGSRLDPSCCLALVESRVSSGDAQSRLYCEWPDNDDRCVRISPMDHLLAVGCCRVGFLDHPLAERSLNHISGSTKGTRLFKGFPIFWSMAVN